MKKYLFTIFWAFIAATSYGDILNDMEWRLSHMDHWGVCNKAPLSGTLPVDNRLRIEDYKQVAPFLVALSEYVYGFDKDYLLSMADLITKSEHSDLVAIFTINTLTPYLKDFGYSEIKRRYVDSTLENINCLNANFGIKDINQLKNIQLFQETAIKILAKSLSTSRPMLSEKQKEKSAEFIAFIGNLMAQPFSEAVLLEIQKRLPEMEVLEKELTLNPFLKSRAIGDLMVIKFLGA